LVIVGEAIKIILRKINFLEKIIIIGKEEGGFTGEERFLKGIITLVKSVVIQKKILWRWTTKFLFAEKIDLKKCQT